MTEPWLRGEGKGWIRVPQPQGVYNITVNDLMLDGIKQWDSNKIMQWFSNDGGKNNSASTLLEWDIDY
jgi:hypothetical protein